MNFKPNELYCVKVNGLYHLKCYAEHKTHLRCKSITVLHNHIKNVLNPTGVKVDILF